MQMKDLRDDISTLILRKIFSYYHQKKIVNSKILILIGIGIVILGIAVIGLTQGTDTTNEPDKKITPDIENKTNNLNITDSTNTYTPKEREWLTSGPFQIDRSEYILGEKIFVRIGNLQLEEKGEIIFLRPLNDTHKSVYLNIPFDGSDRPDFNYYLQPQLSVIEEYCTVDAFVGDWQVMFTDTNYPNLHFKVTEEILPGDEEEYMPVC